MTINTDGPSARIVDLSVLGPQGQVSDVPKPFSVTAGQVGQVFGVDIDNAPEPNIYLAATSVFGLSRQAPPSSPASSVPPMPLAAPNRYGGSTARPAK